VPGFNGYDDFINEALTFGKVLDWDFYKIAAQATQSVAGTWSTLWKATGSPGAGTDPATTPGTAYTNDAGAINWANQTPDQKYLMVLDLMATADCNIMVYDRLVGVSGISFATTGSKTISSTALPRYAGNGPSSVVQAWVEVTTATTTTAPVCHLLSYTDGAGTAGKVGTNVSFPAAATVIGTAIRLPEVAGSQGVQAISTINCDTAGATGIVTVVLLRRLAFIPLKANQGNKINLWLDFPPPIRVFDGASLGMMMQTGAAVTPTISGSLTLAYG
jgi:hypothetical protein